jgi:hypothetical protein
VDLVPVGVADRRHPLAPLHVLRLADYLDARPAQRLDLGVDVVGVEPERCAARWLELLDRGQAQVERAQADDDEGVAEAVPLLEPEPPDVEAGGPGEIGGVEDRKRVVEAQAASVREVMCLAMCLRPA